MCAVHTLDERDPGGLLYYALPYSLEMGSCIHNTSDPLMAVPTLALQAHMVMPGFCCGCWRTNLRIRTQVLTLLQQMLLLTKSSPKLM